MQHRNWGQLLSTPLKRRSLWVGTVALVGWAIASQLSNPVSAKTRFPNFLFTLGVASGDPRPNSVVLWTRLAPDPLNGGGMPPQMVPVQWQIATDETMRRIVRAGVELAIPELAHSVHVEVEGLQPGRTYWYRFRVGDQLSPIGRTQTAPDRGTVLNQFRFAFASCQDYQGGFYTAYQHLAAQDLDLVVHVGDYIYEYGPEPGAPRQHIGGEAISLTDYRNRHALYKTDPHLQAAHAAFPWAVTWDDHEVENNYAGAISENDDEPDQDPQVFLQRRASAYQAYYEHMPLRRTAFPRGANLRLYRRLTFGNLLEFSLLDTRQYRTDQPCGDGIKPRCAEAFSPEATMTGTQQEQWLFRGLANSQTHWNVLAQQTVLAQFDFDFRPGFAAFNLDQWDGYVAARQRLLNFLQQRQIANPVVITGDIHSSWVFDLKADFNNPTSATIGTEFVGTSISSDFPSQFIAPVKAALPKNPQTKFFNGEFRGYVRCEITRDRWQSDYFAVSGVVTPNGTVSKLASFVVENGQPGAQPA